jgi:predicted dehydrogenase
MSVGLIGTGAIAEMHARAYRNIGYRLRVCSSRNQEKARQFGARHDVEVVATMEEVCRLPQADIAALSVVLRSLRSIVRPAT